MPPSERPETSAVRPTPAPSPAANEPRDLGPGAGSRTSRFVVLAFALLFVIGAVAFLARALNAVDGERPSARPSASPGTAVLTGATNLAIARSREAAPMGEPAMAPASPTSGPIASASPLLATPCPSGLLTPDPVLPDPSGLPSPEPGRPGSSPDPVATSEGAGPSASLAPPDPCSDPEPSTGPTTMGLSLRDMPFVPVVRFWQTRDSITREALTRALRGRGSDWDRVLIPEGDRRALEKALGITIPEAVREASPDDIVRAVRRGDTLGLLRVSDVGPSVRALGIDGRQLFGNDRVRGVSRWPLVARVEVADEDAWRQSDAWTLVAGGDSFTDRGLYERVVNRKKGIDYPFDGGTARVTGHHICPSCPRAEGNSVPIYKLSGPKGVVRDLVRDADLAIVNHEQPTPTNWMFHLYGTRFSGKPDLTRIFTRAGIDFMSLANNHINDYGASGVLNTLKTLDRYGIRHAGAGKNVRDAAKPAYLKVNGVTVAIVSCDTIALKHVGATKRRAGAAPCKSDAVFGAIKTARTRADVLIVFPHWGIEFSRGRLKSQERLAARWERMGVDLVVGAHAHVPGGIGDIDGMPVLYSLGNFIFDQNWSTATMEGILAEMTFHGDRLAQIRIHPFLTHDQAQPNLLDPARDDGKALMSEIRKASKRISDW